MILGCTTTKPEKYRALIEATAMELENLNFEENESQLKNCMLVA
jgi:hypothetical protein